MHTDEGIRRVVDALICQLVRVARTPRILAETTLKPNQVFQRAAPHILLTAIGFSDEAFDLCILELCHRSVGVASDYPPLVHAERAWHMRVWGQPFTPTVEPWAGTALQLPFDFLNEAREGAYALTHLLFYATDFGRNPSVSFGRPRSAVLEDVECLVIRYLDQADYDIAAELLMAWPMLGEPLSPTAAFAFRVLTEVEDEAGILPCGNVDPQRLGALEGAERTRYARAVSYHTALVMGLLCAVSLRSQSTPPSEAPVYPFELVELLRPRIRDDLGDWQPIFDRLDAVEQQQLAPMLAQMAVTQALRLRDLREANEVADLAAQHGLPHSPLYDAARQLARSAAAAMVASAGLRRY